MSNQLRKNIVVTYDTTEQAAAALEAAKSKFDYRPQPNIDFNRCEGRKLIWQKSGSYFFDLTVSVFLHEQEGAYPEGVHC